MRYSYEFKLECVELYKTKGSFPPTPEKVKQRSFRDKVRIWVRLYEKHGPDILKHSCKNRHWTSEEKLILINQYKAGNTISSVAIEAGIDDSILYSWVRKYENLGYNGLIDSKKGRPRKNSNMSKKIIKQSNITESELEELIRLREKCTYLEAENEVIKKEIALREEKEAALLKAKKQQSLKNSKSKVTN